MKKQWQIFTNEMIKHGDKVRAYKTAYPNAKSDRAALNNSARLMKNDSILSAIKEGQDQVKRIASDVAVGEAAKKESVVLLTAIEKRQILAKIARGEYIIEEHAVTRVGVLPYTRTPNPQEIAKAIEIDNKMTGENAPTKLEHSGEVKKKVVFKEIRASENDGGS